MNAIERRGLLRIPYRLRGRGTDGIDCLGVVWLIQTHWMKRTLPDPWQSIRQQWREAGSFDATNGLPSNWKRVDEKPQEGDIMLFQSDHVWCATVYQGHVWSAHPDQGVWCKPLREFKKSPKEVWRPC
jgi:cell wall-associated NlpC family hydrolase